MIVLWTPKGRGPLEPWYQYHEIAVDSHQERDRPKAAVQGKGAIHLWP